jgi:hypothetical protein
LYFFLYGVVSLWKELGDGLSSISAGIEEEEEEVEDDEEELVGSCCSSGGIKTSFLVGYSATNCKETW